MAFERSLCRISALVLSKRKVDVRLDLTSFDASSIPEVSALILEPRDEIRQVVVKLASGFKIAQDLLEAEVCILEPLQCLLPFSRRSVASSYANETGIGFVQLT